ncbi:MAG: glycosyltransferase family 2 protein, partial [Bacteroidetes bacterium]|nr:glycosyltransferase family 2 protein [Bacteroidota bacterium]
MKNYYFSEKNDSALLYDLCLIIPTLNRPDTLFANINSLVSNFNKIKPKILIQILISENNSVSNRKIDKSKLRLLLEKNVKTKTIHFVFIKRIKRLSIGRHMNVLSSSVNCNWIMWLGDDDLLTPTYLKFVIGVIESGNLNIQSVFPGSSGITEKEYFHLAKSNENIQRNINIKCYNYNSKNLEYVIHRGHQLSGLLYRKEIIDVSNQILPNNNLYPWMCHQVIAIKKGSILSVSGSHARITSDTNKLFSYKKDGLLPDITEAILCGFSSERGLGTYYASKVITGIGSWRIFNTSKTGIGALMNYILLYYNKRMDRKVFYRSFLVLVL